MKLFASFCKTNPSLHPDAGIGYGCMGITSFYGDALSDAESMAVLQAVYDSGCRHFDTAEAYSNEDPEFHNEKVLGRFLKTVPRDSFSVGTKYWPGGSADDITYDSVKTHLTASLERLQLDYVDVYYSHRVTSVDAGIAFAKAGRKLKEVGLIKAIGLSEVSGNRLKKIYAECPIDAVQQEWSILTRNLEEELVPVCKELDVCVVAYSPLSRNLLVKTSLAMPTDWRKELPRFQALDQNIKFAARVQEISDRIGCTPAQLCLAWILQKAHTLGVDVVPIPGTTKPDRAASNPDAVNVQVGEADMAVLDAMAKEVVGERYTSRDLGITIESQK